MIINGKEIAEHILGDLERRLHGNRPILCDVMVGDDPVSMSYVRIKSLTAQRIGIEFQLEQLPHTATTDEVIKVLQRVQAQPQLCGLIVQLPLPSHIDKQAVLESIATSVDVDCISPQASIGFYNNQGPTLVPPTAGAILYILDHLEVDMLTKKFLVVGQGELVGKPITFLLRQRGYDVTTADQKVTSLSALSQQADIIISGTGRANIITGDMVKPGSIVIDAGTSESGAGIVGDIDFKSVSGVAGALSPVPGGVGPVTVAKLLENVVLVEELKKKSNQN